MEEKGTPTGETANETPDLKNNATPPATSTGVKQGEDATLATQLAELAKEKDKIAQERNMLRNKLDEKGKAEKAAELKELEDKEEFRTLSEQQKTRADALQEELDKKEADEARARIKSKVFADFSTEVKDLAEVAGITVDDTLDETEAEEQLRAKLKVFQDKVGATTGVGPNNQKPEGDPDPRQAQLDKYMNSGNKRDFEQMIKTIPSIANAIKEPEV